MNVSYTYTIIDKESEVVHLTAEFVANMLFVPSSHRQTYLGIDCVFGDMSGSFTLNPFIGIYVITGNDSLFSLLPPDVAKRVCHWMAIYRKSITL